MRTPQLNTQTSLSLKNFPMILKESTILDADGVRRTVAWKDTILAGSRQSLSDGSKSPNLLSPCGIIRALQPANNRNGPNQNLWKFKGWR